MLGAPETDDIVRPFQIDPNAVRGRLVRLGPAVDQIVGQHGYPPAVAGMLGEALSLACLLAGALKYEGVFTLQTKGNGPIRLMVADVTSSGALRGYAQYDAEAVQTLAETRSVPRLLGAGYLAFTVDQGEHTDRYQGIVALEGASLAECAQHYFRQSEQIETGILVAATRIPGTGEAHPDSWRAGGLMVQRLPPASADARFTEDEEDGWRRALMLIGTASPSELTAADLAADDLLYRLFHEEGVKVSPVHALKAECRCSSAKIEHVLRSIPVEEFETLKVDGAVVVTCEFCGRAYRYDDEALAAVLAEQDS
jgi:molecular chaperone Hsp33